jgi:hypothetical protein
MPITLPFRIRSSIAAISRGFIQNVVEFGAEWLYKRDAADPSPKRIVITLNSQPNLDNGKGKVTVWVKDRQIHMAALPLKEPAPAPTLEDSEPIATDDTPGASIPLIHPNDSSRKLVSVTEHTALVTWIAVRPSDSPERVPSSYEFLQNVKWGYDRDITIQSLMPLQATLTRNDMNKLLASGVGLVAGTPKLNPPLAVDNTHTTFL